MKLKLYQIDAFTDKVFSGNPAAVIPLEAWLPDELMQKIALENNLAETAFIVPDGDEIIIRWFTPSVEVDLCGHATLAAGFVLFNYLKHSGNKINFISPRSGPLQVTKSNNLLTLNFPSDKFIPVVISDEIKAGLSLPPKEAYKGKTDYLLVYESEDQIRQLIPDFNLISKLAARGIIVTAPGNQVDFVSRFFAPQSGVNEDPVTGSAHTTLTPYWAARLKKDILTATQLSSRTGELHCRYLGERVEISGKAAPYLVGEIGWPD